MDAHHHQSPSIGDDCACPNCKGVYSTYSTSVSGELRIRYFRCTSCGHKPETNKVILPLIFAPRRRTRSSNVEMRRIRTRRM